MQRYLPHMVSFAATLRQLRPAQAFIFDTKVTETTLAEVASGQVFAGGGNSFDKVLRHIMTHGPRLFSIVTDNFDTVTPSLWPQLRAAGIESLALVFGNYLQPWDRSYHVDVSDHAAP